MLVLAGVVAWWSRCLQRLDMQRCQSAGPVCVPPVLPPVLPACFRAPSPPRHNATLLVYRVLSCPACAGVGKMMWLIDFEGYSLRNAPAVRTSLGVLHTLQVWPRCRCGVCVDTWGKALEAADAAATSGARQACQNRAIQDASEGVWVDWGLTNQHTLQ